MALNDRDKLNRIEELKSRLFGKNYKTRIEHRDSFTHFDKRGIPDAWDGGASAGKKAAFHDVSVLNLGASR